MIKPPAAELRHSVDLNVNDVKEDISNPGTSKYLLHLVEPFK
jgi:hypothetical protein